jgi:hypothetical protein
MAPVSPFNREAVTDTEPEPASRIVVEAGLSASEKSAAAGVEPPPPPPQATASARARGVKRKDQRRFTGKLQSWVI